MHECLKTTTSGVTINGLLVTFKAWQRNNYPNNYVVELCKTD